MSTLQLVSTGGTRSERPHPGFTVYEGGKGKPAAAAPPMLLLTGPAARDAIGDALAPPAMATTHGFDHASYHRAAIDEAAAARGPQPNAWVKDLPSNRPEW